MKKSRASDRLNPRRERYHHGNLPGALKAAALGLIARRGAEGFSLREAAEMINVAPSAAYRHFASKDDLLGAVADDAFAELAGRFRFAVDAVTAQRSSGKSAVERFKALGRAYVRFALDHPARFQAMFGLSASCAARRSAHRSADAARSEHNPAHSAAYSTLALLLDELRTAGVIGEAGRANAEITTWSAIHGLAHLLVSGMLPVPSNEAVVIQCDQTMLRVLAALKSA